VNYFQFSKSIPRLNPRTRAHTVGSIAPLTHCPGLAFGRSTSAPPTAISLAHLVYHRGVQ
jgi:hypothetical protein